MLAGSLPVFRPGRVAAHPVLRGVRAMLITLLLVFIVIVAVPLPHASSPPAVSYRADLATMARAARYPVLVPAGLPLSWVPVSSGVALGGANGAGTATWHLGYVTPSGALASMEESDAEPTEFVRRMTNSGTAVPPVRVAARTWRASVTPGRGQRSFYETDLARVTIVITGSASWGELRTLASSLRPVTSAARTG